MAAVTEFLNLYYSYFLLSLIIIKNRSRVYFVYVSSMCLLSDSFQSFIIKLSLQTRGRFCCQTVSGLENDMLAIWNNLTRLYVTFIC